MSTTRESWLESAINTFRPWFETIGHPLPHKSHVSVGFSYGSRAENGKILGSTWSTKASEDGINHVFISPEIGDTFDVLETLLHELIHVVDDNKSGHRGEFAKMAKELGLTRPWTYTPSSPAVGAELLTIAASLGEYPHGALHPRGVPAKVDPATGTVLTEGGGGKLNSGPPKQVTYMRKLTCTDTEHCPCGGYTVRTTAKWLEIGNPSCPFGTEMHKAP